VGFFLWEKGDAELRLIRIAKEVRTYGEITGSLTEKTLRNLYVRQHKSLQDIANLFGCTRQMVHLLMDKYGIRRRERIKAVKMASSKRKTCQSECQRGTKMKEVLDRK
jgi:predicted DNA-binding protein YlxM (UPF0122 family)